VHIFIVHAFVFGGFRIGQHLGLVAHFPIVACADDCPPEEEPPSQDYLFFGTEATVAPVP
jgi:hypothetical protein